MTDLFGRHWTSAELGEDRMFIDDEVENLGHVSVPHMLAYHVNVGFPILDDGSKLAASARPVEPMSDDSADAVADYAAYGPPRRDWQATVLQGRIPRSVVNKDVLAKLKLSEPVGTAA